MQGRITVVFVSVLFLALYPCTVFGNVAPVVTFDGAAIQSGPEDTALILSHPVRIVDPDVPEGCEAMVVEVTADGGMGTVWWYPEHLSTHIETNVDGATTAILKGSVAQVNHGLSNIRFMPSADFSGSETLTLVVSDGGSCLGDPAISVTVSPLVTLNIIEVADPPDITVTGYTPPYRLSTLEDVVLSLNIPFNDRDSGTNPISVNITSPNGEVLVANPASFVYEEDTPHRKLLTGTQQDFRTHIFQGFQFTPDAHYHGDTTVIISARDDGWQTTTVTLEITVESVNDGPILSPSTPQTNEDTPKGIPIGLVDVDAEERPPRKVHERNVPLTIRSLTTDVTLQTGRLTFANTPLTDQITYDEMANRYTLRGPLEWMKTALLGTVYHPPADWHGTDILWVTVTDHGYSKDNAVGPVKQDTVQIPIVVRSINDAPRMLGVVHPYHTKRDETVRFNHVSAYDVDANSTVDVMNVTIGADRGTLTFGATFAQAGITVGVASGPTATFLATLAQLNMLLNGMQYTNTRQHRDAIYHITTSVHDVDYIRISIDDMGASGAPGPQVGVHNIMVTAHADVYPTCKSFLDVHTAYCGCYYMVEYVNATAPWVVMPNEYPSKLFLKEKAPRRFVQGCCLQYTPYERVLHLTRDLEMGLCKKQEIATQVWM